MKYLLITSLLFITTTLQAQTIRADSVITKYGIKADNFYGRTRDTIYAPPLVVYMPPTQAPRVRADEFSDINPITGGHTWWIVALDTQIEGHRIYIGYTSPVPLDTGGTFQFSIVQQEYRTEYK